MKLYIFRPEGHGQNTLGILAKSLEEAKEKIREYLTTRKNTYEYFENITEYQIEEYEEGQIFENDNT